MRISVFSWIFLGLAFSISRGARFNMNTWILIFEPENKIISQMVTYSYQGESGNPNDKKQGPVPNDPENAPVPVEINISAREVGLDGKVLYPNSAGADNFVVYPSQFILYPGDSKKIQVQWVGSTIPQKEIAYGFISTQIPLEINKDKLKPKSPTGSISIASRYEGVIVVRPRGIKPNVVVDSAFSASDSAGNFLVVLLNNKGTGLQSLKSMTFDVAPVDKGGKIRFGERVQVKDIKPSNANNQSLFPGFRRSIRVPWPAGLPLGPVHANVAFPEGKK
jgi:P pilus assembly chaperone PapD